MSEMALLPFGLIPTPFFFNDLAHESSPPGSLPGLSHPQDGLGGCPCALIASSVSLKQHTDGATVVWAHIFLPEEEKCLEGHLGGSVG